MSSIEPSSAESSAALANVWSTLCRMLAGLSATEEQSRFLERCLDDLLGLFGADRALVLLHHEDGSVSFPCTRTRGRALEDDERLAISRSVTRRAAETGSCVVARPLDDADPHESLVWKGIFLAMAAPLRRVRWLDARPTETAGVLYVDFRDRKRVAGEHERAFLQAMAHVLGAALVPYKELERARLDLSELAARTVPEDPPLEELVHYPSMRVIRGELATAVTSEAPILILGESGTGKTQLARAIAVASGRAPVVRAVLGSSDDLNTITSELFGHERGSFSGALGKRTGLVEFADGGTLVFDEILNLPPQAQQLLLDFTQFGSYRPLGHNARDPKRAKVRIIAATNGDIARAIEERRFREDLYYRLSAVVLELPPLRERRAEIPDLASAILARHKLSSGRAPKLTSAARELLARPEWRFAGNVRQLEAATKRARDRALAEGLPESVDARHFAERDLGGASTEARAATAIEPASVAVPNRETRAPQAIDRASPRETIAALEAERRALEERERALLQAVLDAHSGVVAHAAKELGVARTTLASRIESLGLTRVSPSKRRGG
ncbi:MAG: sigma 54-interacting transcriptional regulator [Polyangiaceae bacterium]